MLYKSIKMFHIIFILFSFSFSLRIVPLFLLNKKKQYEQLFKIQEKQFEILTKK